MHGTTRPRPTIHPAGSGVNAVVWIERGRALIVRGTGSGEPAAIELPLPASFTATPAAMAEVAHRVGNVDRVLIMGTEEMRTALEREIVAIGHRPEAIREEATPGPVDQAALVARLRRLG